MSKTFQTDKARLARKGRLEDFDYLSGSGIRYGNNRKLRAMEKVKERRCERKQQNAENAEALEELALIKRFDF